MVEGRKGEGLTAELRSERHVVRAGLPEKLGGGDEAPDPHRLLEAALAACTILTAQLYANRKGWPLESTDVKVTITAEGAEGNRIRREVSFRGVLDEEQRARLLEIVGKCPIELFLERGAQVETMGVAVS